MIKINLESSFILEFSVSRAKSGIVIKVLDENKINYEIVPTAFDGFVKFNTLANIRKAEVIRALLKQIKE